MPRAPDETEFDPEQMPKNLEAVRDGEFRPLTMDCCTKDDCTQRDYNRAGLLLLENLSRTLASMYLLRDATQALWQCDEAGHTANCPKPGCRFARERDNDLESAQFLLEATVRGACKALAVIGIDLTAQWQEFTDAEQAWVGLQAEVARDDDGLQELMYLESLRDQAVNGNDLEHHRWFRPPPFRETSDGPEA